MDPYLNPGILFMPIMSSLFAINMDQKGRLRLEKQKCGLVWPLK